MKNGPSTAMFTECERNTNTIGHAYSSGWADTDLWCLGCLEEFHWHVANRRHLNHCALSVVLRYLNLCLRVTGFPWMLKIVRHGN